MRKGFTEEEVAAMRERLRKRQEERRAIADIDAILPVANGNAGMRQTVGVIVPIEEARDFVEFQKAKKIQGNWRETAVMVAVSALLLLVSFLAMIG